jgi:hypothetical protein
MMATAMADELDDRSKDLVVDIVVLALSRCTQGGVGLAFRSKVRNDRRLFASEEGHLDLRPVWTLLAAQTGIDLQSTKPAFRYVKSVADRLGATVIIPDHIDDAAPPGDTTPLVAREEIDRFFVAASTKAVTPPGARSLPCLARRLTPLPGAGSALKSAPPVRTPTPLPAPAADRTPTGPVRTPTGPLRTRPPTTPPANRTAAKPPAQATPARIAVAIGALVVAIACIWFVARPALSGGREWSTMPPAELSTDIPIASARVSGREIHVELADPAWLELPEISRTSHLKTALELVHDKDLTVIVITDGGKVRASAQWFGNPPAPRVRFY